MPEKPILDQTRMPYVESLLTEKARQRVAFHMPGHKGTLPLHPMMQELLGHDIYTADLVEINGLVDYLHNPKDALRDAQALAADAYGVEQTYFLINGSTGGNQAAIMSVASEGDNVIMARASHRSVYGGIVLSGATPLYVNPTAHPEIGFPLAINPSSIERLFAYHENIVAVHITSPNYYGVLCDVDRIAEIAHTNDAVLIVDEAHGSHLPFHDHLPQSAIESGADIVVHSTHKTQSALTQASMLHLNTTHRAQRTRLEQVLSLLQSSSPSAVLLATLDHARMLMATQGYDRLTKVLHLCRTARETLQQIEHLHCYDNDLVGAFDIADSDPTKLIVRTVEAGYTGFDAYQFLRDSCGVDGEFSDVRQVIFSLTIGDTEETLRALTEGLQKLSTHHRAPISIKDEVLSPSDSPELVLTPRQAYTMPSRAVPLQEAIGEIVAENIIPYPPGIPLLVPGETLDHHQLTYLEYIIDKGVNIVGMEDKTLAMIRVI